MSNTVKIQEITVEKEKKDPVEALRIFNWIGKNLEAVKTAEIGKSTHGTIQRSWRYRMGDSGSLPKFRTIN